MIDQTLRAELCSRIISGDRQAVSLLAGHYRKNGYLALAAALLKDEGGGVTHANAILADCVPPRKEDRKTYPERIRDYVRQTHRPGHVDAAVADLMDVATGNREGTPREIKLLAAIFPESALAQAQRKQEPLYEVDACVAAPDGGSDGAYDIVENLPERATADEVADVIRKVLRDGFGMCQGDKDVDGVVLQIHIRKAK